MALVNSARYLARSSRVFHPAATRWYGDDGAIRDAGGAFGKKQKAVEDQYFRKKEIEQMEKLKKETEAHHKEEIGHHEEEINDLEDQIKRHKEKIKRHKDKMDD